MKKTVYILNINNYSPKIREITIPLIKKYAEKIGAEFYEITERKYPDMPIVYEKFQIKDLARERGDDWIIYIDSDTIVHPDLFDITEVLPVDTVLQHGKDFANNRWVCDDYFRRDGRFIGTCNWFTIANKMCLDLWQPIDMSLEDAMKNIYPIQREINFGLKKEHFIDDYVLSRNLSRYGLKYTTFYELLEKLKLKSQNYLYHEFLYTEEEKLNLLKAVIKNWEI